MLTGHAEPAGQVEHSVAPCVVLYCGATHTVGDEVPDVGHIEPMGQVVHVACEALEYVPVAHATGAALLTAHEEPAGHVWQAALAMPVE